MRPDEFVHADEFIDTEDEPNHQALCRREQESLLRAILEDLDLSEHMADAVKSLRIVLAADESVRTGSDSGPVSAQDSGTRFLALDTRRLG